MKKLTKLQKQFLILLVINILNFIMFSIYNAIHIFVATFSIYCINSLAYKKIRRRTKVLLAILIASIGSGIYLYTRGINSTICFYLGGIFFYSYEKKIFHKRKAKGQSNEQK